MYKIQAKEAFRAFLIFLLAALAEAGLELTLSLSQSRTQHLQNEPFKGSLS